MKIMEIIAVISLCVAIASLYVGFKKLKQRTDEQKQLRAPLLQVTQYEPKFGQYKKTLHEDANSWPIPGQFTFDRRSFINTDSTKPPETMFSLYLNATENTAENVECWLGIGLVYVRNIGNNISYAKIEKATIQYLNKKTLSMVPREVNREPVHCFFNMANNEIEILLTIKAPTRGDYRCYEFGEKSNFAKKMELYEENALNIYVPGNLRCDLWEEIKIYLVTYNAHNEEYRQVLEFQSKHGIITTSSRLL